VSAFFFVSILARYMSVFIALKALQNLIGSAIPNSVLNLVLKGDISYY
jgi:hypothetical protein